MEIRIFVVENGQMCTGSDRGKRIPCKHFFQKDGWKSRLRKSGNEKKKVGEVKIIILN